MTLFAFGFLCGSWLVLTRQESATNHFETMLGSFPWSNPSN